MNGASKPSLAVFSFLPNIRPRSRRMIHSLSTTQHSVHRNGWERWEMGNGSWGRSGSPAARPPQTRLTEGVRRRSASVLPPGLCRRAVFNSRGPGACRRLLGQSKWLKPPLLAPDGRVAAPHRPPTGSTATHPRKIRLSSKTTLIITSSLIAENN